MGLDNVNLEGLTRLLQACISPVAMISGVGLLILSLTNRFGRVMDRVRDILRTPGAQALTTGAIEVQVRILHQRARILRASITYAVGCVLFVSLVVLSFFASAVCGVALHMLVLLLFALSLVCLIASLVFFLWDMHLSLGALQAEMRRAYPPDAPH